jgi:hypothetical protein
MDEVRSKSAPLQGVAIIRSKIKGLIGDEWNENPDTLPQLV